MTSLIAAGLAAISVLSFVLYLRRHRRRDRVMSYLGMNVGVLAVATALSGSAAGLALGPAVRAWWSFPPRPPPNPVCR